MNQGWLLRPALSVAVESRSKCFLPHGLCSREPRPSGRGMRMLFFVIQRSLRNIWKPSVAEGVVAIVLAKF